MENKLLAIELTDNLLRYVYLTKSQSAYQIVKVGTSDHAVDFAHADSLAVAVNNILTKEEILPQRIFLTLSRKDIFIHQLIVPQMSAGELDEVVSTEIDKIPEFADKEVDYVAKVYPHKRDNTKVLFTAVLKDKIDFIVHNLQALRIPCFDVEVAPMNLPHILSSPYHAKNEEPKTEAVLTIFENHSLINFYKGPNHRVFYKIPIGILQLVSRDRTVVEVAMTNFVAQLRRILKGYSAEYKDQPISQLQLVWDNDIFAKLPALLSGHLDIKVDPVTVDILHEFAASSNQQSNPVYLFALTPVVCRLRKIKADFALEHFLMKLNREKYIRQIVASSLMTAAVFLLIFGLTIFGLNQQIGQMNRSAQKAQAERVKLKNDSQELYIAYADYVDTRNRLLQQATYIQKLNRISWSEVLAVVANELPQNLGLTNFYFSEGGSARIRGQSLTMEPIAALIRRIEDSAILEKGQFDYLTEREFRGDDSSVKYLEFGIMAKLKTPKEESVSTK